MLRSTDSILRFVTDVYSSKNSGDESHASFWRTCGVMLLMAYFLSFLPNHIAVLSISKNVVLPVPVVPVINSPGNTVLDSFQRFMPQHAIACKNHMMNISSVNTLHHISAYCFAVICFPFGGDNSNTGLT